jgi:hypothetical protein
LPWQRREAVIGVPENPATISDIEVYTPKGPWGTKSGGNLFVLAALSAKRLKEGFFRYDPRELAEIPEDIRGLRLYSVQNLLKGRIGGGEFHRIRREILFCLEGEVLWTCNDLFGGETGALLRQNEGILVPSFILHSYRVKKGKASLLVIANTLFNPADTGTYDTYSAEIFAEMQNRICNRK